MSETYFAPCPRGLEAPLAAEIASLGAQDIAPAEGGVGFAGDLTLALHANLESRLASRVLWRVGGGSYRNERDLYDVVQAIDWPRHFDAKRTLRVDVAASTRRAAPRVESPPGGQRSGAAATVGGPRSSSPLTSLEFATLRTKDAVCDRQRAATGIRPSIDKRAPDVRVQDVALEPVSRAWAPRELPRPLTASAGSRAAAMLDVEAARESMRQAALEEAMRERAEAQRPPSIDTARVARADFAGMGYVDDAEIEAHVRGLLARRASGQ